MSGSIQSIERAAAAIHLLAASTRPLRLTEIATALQLPRGTAHGILKTLCDVGFIDQDRATGRYELGEHFREIEKGSIDINELRVRSMNWADPLAARTGTAARVATADEHGVLVVHYVLRPDSSRQRPDVGAHLPAHATALGQVLLAYSADWERHLDSGLTSYTQKTITDRKRLQSVMSRTRDLRLAVERDQFALGRASIAAPILGYGGLVVAAVGIHGEADQLTNADEEPRPKLAVHVRQCAHAISRALQISRAAR